MGAVLSQCLSDFLNYKKRVEYMSIITVGDNEVKPILKNQPPLIALEKGQKLRQTKKPLKGFGE